MRWLVGSVFAWGLVAAGGCSTPARTQPPPPPLYPATGAQYPQQQYPQQQYPQQQYPQQQYPQQQYPQQANPNPQPPAVNVPAPPPRPLASPSVPLEAAALRTAAQNVVQQLQQDLPPRIQARVQGIPMVFQGEVGEINAYAACTRDGHSAFGITDALLEVTWWLAQSAAHDEVFGGDRTQRYISKVVLGSAKGKPLPRPEASFFSPTQADPRVVGRAQTLLEEQLAFALGHELAHHYLGHLPCTAPSTGLSQAGRILTDALPSFNQPAEHFADGAAVHGLLTTGRRRSSQGYAGWTESGALLLLQFFQSASGGNSLIDFQRTHPAPAARKIWVTSGAGLFRNTGGAPLPLP